MYLNHVSGVSAVGLRRRQSPAAAHDRYALGVHHVAFAAGSRAVDDERAAWLAGRGARLEIVHVPPRPVADGDAA